MLPTVLIGVIAIAFEKASRKRKAEEQEAKKVKTVRICCYLAMLSVVFSDESFE